MYLLYKLKIWFIQTFTCIHEWSWREYGIECRHFATCKKCGKFTDKT